MNLTIFDFPHPFDVDDIAVNRIASIVQLLHEFGNPTVVLVFDGFGLLSTLIDNGNLETSIEECGFSQSGIQDVIIKFSNRRENFQIRFERDGSSG